jgi:hypothetical protein
MNPKDIQLAFLNKVKASLPQHVSFAEELSELLNTSTDSAYRRLRGDTLLGIDEIAKICSHFKVSFDNQENDNHSSVSFKYFKLGNDEKQFKKWLTAMVNDVKQIKSVKGSRILYAADDVPIWHHFFDEQLTAFKIFYWLKSIVNAPKFSALKFDISHIDKDYIELAQQLLLNYNEVQSTEIWSEDTLNSTLKQVEYYWESGFFETKEVALNICDAIERSIKVLQTKCENESKMISTKEGNFKNFQMYHSEIMIGNNSILVYIGESKISYLSNNTFNMISTSTPAFVEENEAWIYNLTKKSILISGVSEKQRNQFFKIMFQKIDALRIKLN